MKSRFIMLLALIVAVSTISPTKALAVEKLKWAHVYEISEPYHTWALWAADEIKKRSNDKYEVEVFPASSLGKEVDINEGLSLGTVDIIWTGFQFAGRSYGPIGISGYPYVYRSVDHWRKFLASDLFRIWRRAMTRPPVTTSSPPPIMVKGTSPRTSRSAGLPI